ncbi:PREDICTED: heart- and neural crest derivatives-expressed protein 2 [Galeopterus variegatus]|uniref:Heart- and neural crest derivatives-expressed protein 2 n=1 Tax=Galeopterus variegatus TaxID=482537 RepID=A0ABM0RPL6_GALVR|nr:PREDICTED: heart- and neural crest derivatives-expressed protein 2 [Galeopterus variegatus]
MVSGRQDLAPSPGQHQRWALSIHADLVFQPKPRSRRPETAGRERTVFLRRTQPVSKGPCLWWSHWSPCGYRGQERRRTQSINSAFAELRECIPNVPADTKLSKIKTLRLATSYIAYLMDLLAKDDQNGEAEAFKAEIKKTDVKEEKRKKELNEILKSTVSSNDKKTKGRTGWPQHVWALELKQ